MQIQNLEIENFRGIIKLEADLKCGSVVFSGENGTGKSGVIDAIDFIFSGKIRRLTGEGSKSLSIEKHGKHVDKDAANSKVQLTIKLNNGELLTVKRTVAKGKLELVNGDTKVFESLGSILGNGQYLLSRRELLRFIACEAGKRSEEIQELLDLSDADKIRADITALLKKHENLVNGAKADYTTHLNSLDLVLKPLEKKWDGRLLKINELRALFKAGPIQDFESDTDFLVGINWASQTGENQITRKSFGDLLDRLQLSSFPELTDIKEKDPLLALKNIAEQIASKDEFLQLISEHDLVSKGMKLVGHSDKCPLCDVKWKSSDLITHLTGKLEKGKKAKELEADFNRLSLVIKSHIKLAMDRIFALEQILKKLDREDQRVQLNEWNAELKAWSDKVTATSNAKDLAKILGNVSSLLGFSKSRGELLDTLEKFKDELPEESAEEKAYKDLVSAKTAYQNYSRAVGDFKKKDKRYKIIKSLAVAYENSRKVVFEKLYKDIEVDFTRFYRFLNYDDEGTFTANFKDLGNSLALNVDFFGRGPFPPNALHSEGHQDGMGICIYLALMKRLKGTDFTIGLLDDVMMSIDGSHRKRLCELLNKEFPKTQFIITTHDKIWANQLRRFNVIKRKDNQIYFRSWSLETGPIYDSKNTWERLLAQLKLNEVSEAAPRLRKFLEQEFQEICGALSARLIYNTDHLWHLGEFKHSAIEAFKSLLKDAKFASNSFGKQEEVKQLSLVDARLNEALGKAGIHEGDLNWIIHHNSWENLTKEEFGDTVQAMKGLLDTFNCDKCNATYSLSYSHGERLPDTLGCNCQKFILKAKQS